MLKNERYLFLKIFLALNLICVAINISLYYLLDFKSSFIEAIDKKDIFLISLAFLCYVILSVLLYFVLELRKKLRYF